MIVYNNETIKNLIMDALDKKERGIEINVKELVINILKYADRDFGLDTVNRKYTEEELQNSIYIHVVNENNKCYVGQTSINPKRRWGFDGSGYKGQVFYNAIKYYGWDNISHVVLCHGLSEEEVNKMEIALISLFKSTNREEFGYNLQTGGNTAGKHSEESKKKMSEARKGKHLSKEHKKKMSEAHKGKRHSEETRNKMSEANTGENNYWYGKHLSKEHKNKIGEAKKGEKHPKAKKVYCNGVIFQTAKECSEYYNVNYGTMKFWLQGKVKKIPSEFTEKGLRYATQEDIEKYPLYIKEEQNQQNKQD